MSNHFHYARSMLDGTSPYLHMRTTTRCVILSADWGDEWTIMSSLLAVPINRLTSDDCSVTNCVAIKTAKVKRPPHHKCDAIPDTIKTLLQPKIEVCMIQLSSSISRKGAISQFHVNYLTWASKGVSEHLLQGRKEKSILHHCIQFFSATTRRSITPNWFSINIVLSLIVHFKWPLKQLDVKNTKNKAVVAPYK